MRVILLSLFFLIAWRSFSQDLIHSRTTSYFTQIYKITNEQAAWLYEHENEPLSESFFHTLVDYYPTDSIYRKDLQYGHYLFVSTSAHEMKYELHPVNSLEMYILNNSRDLMLIFKDDNGKEIEGLEPVIGNKKIGYHPKTKTYRLPTSNRQGTLRVSYAGHENFFFVKRRYDNTFFSRAKRRVMGTFPINHIISPFRYLVLNTRSLIKHGYVSAPGIYNRIRNIGNLFNERDFDGYVALNKPKYKPGDTVKIKAFVVNKRGKPVSKELDVTLHGPSLSRNNTTTLGSVKPYRAGAYTFDFVLTDSLKLILDNNYHVYFYDKRYNSYPSASFRYEVYELKQNQFFLRQDDNNERNKPASVYLKGTDSNDLPLYDVRVELKLIAESVNAFYDQTVFVPDTLWQHSLKLDPLGETKVTFPDSLYRNVNFNYKVIAAFINAENERHDRTLNLAYDAKALSVTTKLEADTFVIRSADQRQFWLQAKSRQGKELWKKLVSTEHKEKIESHAYEYNIIHGQKIIRNIKLDQESDGINVMAQRTSDSLIVLVENSRKLLFRYQLFRNNTLVQNGYSTSYAIQKETLPNDNYYFAIEYLWAGESKHQDFDLPFAKKPLSITMDHPATVFPGQTVDFSISVNDAYGKPVSGTDLTAYAITKKFRASSYFSLPSYETFKNRKVFNSFNHAPEQRSASARLEYNFWRKALGLDSIAFYQFLYPGKTMFTNFTPVEDSITQIAPYVVDNGVLQPIYYIYINDQLKYYHASQNITPYSFQAHPTVYKITIRTLTRLITIDGMQLRRGHKLICSIDLQQLPEGCTSVAKPELLTQTEIADISARFMWVNRDNTQSRAYLQQGDSYLALTPSDRYNNHELVGPFFPGYVTYTTNFKIDFRFKPRMLYTFEPNLVDRESTSMINIFGTQRPSYKRPSFYDRVQTEKSILEYWKQLDRSKSFSFRKIPSSYAAGVRHGALRIKENYSIENGLRKLATFVLNLNTPDEYYIFPGQTPDLTPLKEDLYQVVIIFEDESYLKPKPVHVKAFGRTFYDIASSTLCKPDAFSREVMSKLKKWSTESVYAEQARMHEMQDIRESYYQEQRRAVEYSGGRWVSGRINAGRDGSGLPGINVLVKGTANGTVTDAEGNYNIYVPYGAVLVFSFIGYQTEEVAAGNATQIDYQLEEDVAHLSEVVVVGYGVQTSRALTGSVTTVLQGRTPGVVMSSGVPGIADSVTIRIRGLSSFPADHPPLVVIDGVLKRFDEIDPSLIQAIEVLQGEQAMALYGSRAAQGVVLISTKKGTTTAQLLKTKLPEVPQLVSIEESAPGNALRKNFNDYAFWQPRLTTDENGTARFNATFPDDITGWRIHVVGMASKKRTGQYATTVQSFKPLVAQLLVPNFLVAGDSSAAIGKITNYTSDSLQIKRLIDINDKPAQAQTIGLKNSWIDSIGIVASSDSMKILYQIENKEYRDGEERTVKILPLGTKESKGTFAALPSDTTFTLNFDPSLGDVKLYVQADMLDVLLDEIAYLRGYSYECNEQMASKVKALLAEKAIRNYRDEKFDHDALVKKLLKKLAANQAKDGGWSWWSKGDEGSAWISLHIAETFSWAEREHYPVPYDKRSLYDYLSKDHSKHSPELQLRMWIFLSGSNQHIMAQSLVDSLAKKHPLTTQHLGLLKTHLLQLNGNEPDWQWIKKEKSETLKGNWYWGEEKTSLWNNDIDNTLIVYRIMALRNAEDPDLFRLRNFMLEKRSRTWRNTYESAQIIETILPSLLKRKGESLEPKLIMSGDASLVAEKFPLEKQFKGVRSLTIAKTGIAPVYLTAYQDVWNTKPLPEDKHFKIKTQWKDDLKDLTAGKPVTLEVELTVLKDAEYVMISIPVPAGCSYESKEQDWRNGETHREYDLHETRIYCQELRAGKYQYSIKLIPRFKGRYSVNPAKIEWMYFPVIFGREAMKKVSIR